MELKKQTLPQRAENLRISPSERVWDRLEKRLDQDHDKIKISTFRKWMGFAASLLVLISIFFLFNLSRTNETRFMVVDLEPVPSASFAYYRFASELNMVYDQHGWTEFREGNRRRFKSPSGEKPFSDQEGEYNQPVKTL